MNRANPRCWRGDFRDAKLVTSGQNAKIQSPKRKEIDMKLRPKKESTRLTYYGVRLADSPRRLQRPHHPPPSQPVWDNCQTAEEVVSDLPATRGHVRGSGWVRHHHTRVQDNHHPDDQIQQQRSGRPRPGHSPADNSGGPEHSSSSSSPSSSFGPSSWPFPITASFPQAFFALCGLLSHTVESTPRVDDRKCFHIHRIRISKYLPIEAGGGC